MPFHNANWLNLSRSWCKILRGWILTPLGIEMFCSSSKITARLRWIISLQRMSFCLSCVRREKRTLKTRAPWRLRDPQTRRAAASSQLHKRQSASSGTDEITRRWGEDFWCSGAALAQGKRRAIKSLITCSSLLRGFILLKFTGNWVRHPFLKSKLDTRNLSDIKISISNFKCLFYVFLSTWDF